MENLRVGNSISSVLETSEEEKQQSYKKQYDSYISGHSFMLSISESFKAMNDLDDYNKWSENFVEKNSNNVSEVTNYIKKQNLDSVQGSINGNYQQAYYSLLLSETVQGAARNKGMKIEASDILPIQESLELVSEKLTPEERFVSNTVARTGLNKMVSDVAYSDGELGSKEALEQNIVSGYAMSLNSISQKDYMQSYGGLSIINGVKDIMQKEYPIQEEQHQIRGVTPQASSFTQRNISPSARQI